MDASTPKESDAHTDQATLPKHTGVWGTILTTTPIVLTILATAFAGLSSSEMTQSMYYRSLAAQHQSKAGDQWAFFQAKRTRGTSFETTVQLLQGLAEPDEFAPAQLETVSGQLLQLLKQVADEKRTSKGDENRPRQQAAKEAASNIEKARTKWSAVQPLPDNPLASLVSGTPLPVVPFRTLDKPEARDSLDAMLQALAQRQTEAATVGLVARLTPDDIEQAARLAEEDADAFDKACTPINHAVKQVRAFLSEVAAALRPLRKIVRNGSEDHAPLGQAVALFDGLNNSFKAAALDYDGRRLRQESLYNKRAAEVYEVRVRRSALASDRHRDRSKKFFYCMLLAQAGVTISTLALAGARRSWLWLFAALAGITALGFSAYVYLLS